jgi:hypothetical protein
MARNNRRMRIAQALSVVAASGLLASCASAHDTSTAPDTSKPVTLDEPSHLFYPRPDPTDGMTAAEAFKAMLRDQHHPAKAIPANVTARYGLLTQDDTSPPADRMPVWAFTVENACVTSTGGGSGRCMQWVFTRASDGKPLGVVDQQPLD